MGGIGYAMSSGRQINVMWNPASYACIDSLTFLFDMGVGTSNCPCGRTNRLPMAPSKLYQTSRWAADSTT